MPISRGFSRAGLNRNTERMRNVLKRHEVFSHMTDEEQTRALMVRRYIKRWRGKAGVFGKLLQR